MSFAVSCCFIVPTNAHRNDIFVSTLQHLRERHKGLITYGKSWQQSKAKAAEKSIAALTSAIQSSRRSSAASSIVLVAAFVVMLLVFLSRQEVFQVSNQWLFCHFGQRAFCQYAIDLVICSLYTLCLHPSLQITDYNMN